MSDKQKRQVVKLHKSFLEEIEACKVLERQGQQGFSSLVNIAERLPHVMSEKGTKYGVLDSMDNVRVLLQQRHFESLEKTSTYIAQVIQGFFDRVENMQRAMSTCADVLDQLPVVDQHLFVVELMEWMENVLTMYEREYPFDERLLLLLVSSIYIYLPTTGSWLLNLQCTAGRKKGLGQHLEYWNVSDLQARQARWLSSSVHGHIKADYVAMVVDAVTAASST
ncbi:hypothetical protein, variant 1 [Aphanomyces astaci]|uniref:Uncharacterized protein n=1 Tax=Aphanomyces astaci TaxID=112090 RepID=W4GTR5_APHAT|nr:hypothetical protein, variant 1 [Aphanomyces astaci]ETV82414.1 hypothetical protein, variant 1 [Aphanomyces astaci]|eukprot:XP_009828083.1 hypothetical protein, variant 1 [Aphanomyces astaci]